jgi:predicted alpha/beta superfamily hydrolase
VHYPAGSHTLAIRGSAAPLSWDSGRSLVAAGPGSPDTHQIALQNLAQPIEFKPLLDDKTWSRGANYRVSPSETVDVYPRFTGSKGKVIVLIAPFHSQALGNDRTIRAYLPPSYDENSLAAYPVLYMHDGQNLFDAALAFGGNEWRVDETLDAGAEAADRGQSIREIIVIGVDNTGQRMDEYTPTVDAGEGAGGKGDSYLKLIVEELKPKVDAMLRTRMEREWTGTLGSSLGGLISAHAGVKRVETFGRIGVMSPSTWWDNRMIIAEVASLQGKTTRPLWVYVDSGDSDTEDGYKDTKDLAQTYLSVGYKEGVDFHYVVQSGALHNEVYWAQRLPEALRFLFGTQSP